MPDAAGNRGVSPGCCRMCTCGVGRCRSSPPWSNAAGWAVRGEPVTWRCKPWRPRPKAVVYAFLTSRVEQLLAAGAPRVWVVLDNLNIHRSPELKGWLADLEGRVRFLFTPFHASWLNLVESLLRFCVTG